MGRPVLLSFRGSVFQHTPTPWNSHRQHLGALDDPGGGLVIDVKCGEEGHFRHPWSYDVRPRSLLHAKWR